MLIWINIIMLLICHLHIVFLIERERERKRERQRDKRKNLEEKKKREKIIRFVQNIFVKKKLIYFIFYTLQIYYNFRERERCRDREIDRMFQNLTSQKKEKKLSSLISQA